MKHAAAFVRFLAVLILVAAAIAGACNRASRSETANATAAAGATAGDTYPAPRWPSYFKPPKTVDDLMPAARALVRNQSGLQGKGMGIVAAGESVLIVANNDADPMGMDAIRRALVERKVTPHIKFVYEMSGETREQGAARSGKRGKGHERARAGS